MKFSSVGDHVELQRGNTYKSALLDQPGPYLLGLGSIGRDGGFRADKLRTYGGPSQEKLLVHPGDLYVSLKDVTQSGDLLGSIARVPENISVGRMTQDTVKLIFKSDISRPYFYWLLRTPQYRQHCRSCATGTTNLGLSRDDFFSFQIPELTNTRQKVVDLLEATEKKISLNESINQTLEQMAQAIFKSWFVDFEPVKAKIAALAAGGSEKDALLAAMQSISGKDSTQLATMQAGQPEQYAELSATAELFPSAMQESELGEIPWGWQVSNIDKTTSLIIDHRGKTPKKLGGDWSETGYVALSAKHIKNGQIVNRDQLRCVNEELYIKWMKDELQKGDILLTSEGPMGEMYYLSGDEKYCLSQRLYALRADVEKINPGFLYHWLNSPLAKADMEGRATGTTVVGIRQAELRKVKVICPQKSLTDAFGKVAQSSLDNSALLTKESLSLSAIRDSLLPRLLSGESGVEGVK